jgi:hypothetical protein
MGWMWSSFAGARVWAKVPFAARREVPNAPVLAISVRLIQKAPYERNWTRHWLRQANLITFFILFE